MIGQITPEKWNYKASYLHKCDFDRLSDKNRVKKWTTLEIRKLNAKFYTLILCPHLSSVLCPLRPVSASHIVSRGEDWRSRVRFTMIHLKDISFSCVCVYTIFYNVNLFTPPECSMSLVVNVLHFTRPFMGISARLWA